MNGWDQLIARLTQPLEVDEELRLDVARELRCHLEDSAAEFRAAGESPAEAAASATKALGDEAELTEQLWQANRARIRLRGVLRWTARATLLPAALLVTLLLFAYLLGISGYIQGFSAGEGGHGGPGWPLGPLGKLVCDPYVGVHLTADQRFLLEGAPDARTDLDKAKSIADRWPDNRIYYADYVAYLLNQPGFRKKRTGDQTEQFDEVMLAQALAALHKGEQIDPDNAFYNAEAASLLIQASSTLHEDPSATYDKLTREDKVEAGQVFTIQITDPQRFQQGLEEFHRALGKPLWTTLSVEMLRLRLGALGAPTRLIQYLNRLALCFDVPLPGLGDARELGKSLGAYARVLAADGKATQGVQLLEDVRRLAGRMGAQSGAMLIQLLVAQGMTTHALGCEEVIARELGRAKAGEAAPQERMKEYRFFYHIRFGRDVGEAEFARRSFLEMLVMPRLPGYKGDTKPLRIAEQFVFAQLGLLGLLAVLVLVCALLGLVVVWDLVFLPKADRAVLLFVGWGRLGRICLLGVVVPVAVYGCYVFAMGAWAPTVGLLAALDRVCLEFLALGGVILVLLIRLSRTAIARRAAELGMGAPLDPFRRAHPWWTAVLAILGTGLLAYFVGWWAGPFRRFMTHGYGDVVLVVPIIGGLALVAVGVSWMLWCIKQGMEASRRPFWRAHPWWTAVLAIMGTGLLAYLVGWWAGGSSDNALGPALLTVGLALAAVDIGWIFRCIKRDMEASPRPFRRAHPRLMAGLIAVLTIMGMGLLACLAGWWATVKKYVNDPGAGAVLTLPMLLALPPVVVSWRVWWLKRGDPAQRIRQPEGRRFRQSLRRSLIPILAAAVIVVGVGLGGLLAVGEGYAIRETGAGMPMPDEIANSDFRLLQEHFVELDKAFQRQEASPADHPGR